VISGGTGPDRITGYGGDDTLISGDEPDFGDFLDGGPGNDVIRGQAGNDFITDGPGNDDVDGGDGRDFIYSDSAPNGADNVVGRARVRPPLVRPADRRPAGDDRRGRQRW